MMNRRGKKTGFDCVLFHLLSPLIVRTASVSVSAPAPVSFGIVTLIPSVSFGIVSVTPSIALGIIIVIASITLESLLLTHASEHKTHQPRVEWDQPSAAVL
ncbi:unnamed protein product [Discosporangium mesarthrocarpum]